ncbi:SDR family oxidoreductase [Cellulomonas sp. URHD0024]|uniref:SDR family oxidoreductase n=1 Tax=Cellulomonas sp. URHD0024 TaxID=1302620 RepID=UPI0004088C90|nr:NAD(P)H-binding protein [Cellulomonas sp. URHD0024]
MTILVAGATGNIGREVIAVLVARGATVRALVRSPAGAAQLPKEVEPVLGDLRDARAVEGALTGVSAALYVSPHDPDEVQLANLFVSTCERLDVRLVFAGVAVTAQNPFLRWGMRALVNAFLPHYRGKLRIAKRIGRAVRTRPVILGLANYYQNDELIRDEILAGAYCLPTHRSGVNRVDLRDVGEIAARALIDPAFPAGAYGLVGPASVSGVEAAATWSRVLHRPVAYDGDRPDRPDVLARHLDGPKLADYRRSYAFLGKHGVPTSRRDVAATTDLLGRPPRDYEAFVRDTARRWGALQQA